MDEDDEVGSGDNKKSGSSEGENPKQELEDVTKFKAKKSKAQAKKGRGSPFEMHAQLGIPREEVAKFADASYWLKYFPPLCQEHCASL